MRLILLALWACLLATGRAAPTKWPGPYPGITFEELEPRLRAGSVFLLDVRNRSELLDPGRVPNSLNLPLHELDQALALSPEEFRGRYGFLLPPPEEEMILMCRSGFRAQVAAARLIPAGYTRLRLYYGSFKDWARRGAPFSREIGAAELASRLRDDQSTVLDVRPTAQRTAEGDVNGSRALPRESLGEALRLPPGDFKSKFGFEKPAFESVLTVIGGRRNHTLALLPILNAAGYFDIRLYLGSLEDLNAGIDVAA